MDTLHMAFIVVEVWHYLIVSFGNFGALRPVNWYYTPYSNRQFYQLTQCLLFSALKGRIG